MALILLAASATPIHAAVMYSGVRPRPRVTKTTGSAAIIHIYAGDHAKTRHRGRMPMASRKARISPAIGSTSFGDICFLRITPLAVE